MLHWVLAVGILVLMILNGSDSEYKIHFPGQEVVLIVAVCLVGIAGLVMTYFQHYFVIIFYGEKPTSCQVCNHRPLTLPDVDTSRRKILMIESGPGEPLPLELGHDHDIISLENTRDVLQAGLHIGDRLVEIKANSTLSVIDWPLDEINRVLQTKNRDKHNPMRLVFRPDTTNWEIWEWTFEKLEITKCNVSESRKIYENKLRHAAFIFGTKVNNKNFLTDTLAKFNRYNLFAENCQQFAHAIFRKAQRKEDACCWRGFTWLCSFLLANSFGIPITTMFVLIDISHYNDQASVDGAHVYLAAHIFVMIFVSFWFLGSSYSLSGAGQGALLGIWLIFIGIFCIYSYCDAHKEDVCDLWDKDNGVRGFICIASLFFVAAIGTIIISTPSCLRPQEPKELTNDGYQTLSGGEENN